MILFDIPPAQYGKEQLVYYFFIFCQKWQWTKLPLKTTC